MSLYIKDRIYQETATEGTGKLTLTNVKEGYQGFISLPNGSQTYYCITNNTDWEVGQGQYVNDGTNTLTRTLLSSSTRALLDLKGTSSVFCTYPAEKAVLLNFDGNIYLPDANIQGQKFIGNGSGLTNIDAGVNDLVPEAPTDGETYARDNKTWVSISDSAGIPDAPVDDIMYGRKNGEWDPVADSGDFYTKEESDAIDNAQDVKIVINNYDIAKNTADITTNKNNIAINSSNIAGNTTKTENNALAIGGLSEEVSTNTTNISTNTGNISTNTGNISSNTTAIGTLSGQVGQNSEDIAELQDSIFFTSAYSADYPSTPNRDPENGNMYLQNFAMFTYSYAEATQIFCSKTDESGNVRQFTAIKPGDSVVLNEVDSPNYGRYELVSVEDVSGDYVVMNVIPKLGQGTVITGVKVAFQAFPQPGGGTGDGIPEAPIDGKQYGRQDAEWTEVTGGGSGGSTVSCQANVSSAYGQNFDNNVTAQVGFDVVAWDTDSNFSVSASSYTPDVAGYYQVNALVTPQSDNLVRGITSLFKNTTFVAGGYNLSESGIKTNSAVNTVVYCNGVDDRLVIKYNPTITGEGSTTISSDAGLTYFNVTLMGGSGGTEAPVILKATFSTTSSIPGNAWTPITFDVADVDTNDGLDVANKWYKPNVAGYYNVAVSTYVIGTGLIRGISGVWKNDERVQQGTETYNASTPVSSITSLTNTIVYCNGTTDYIQPKVLGNAESALQLGAGAGTQLNISRIASSSSGDSLWSDVGGLATTSLGASISGNLTVGGAIYIPSVFTNTVPTAPNVVVDSFGNLQKSLATPVWTEVGGVATYDGSVKISSELSVGGVDSKDYSLYDSVFKVPNGQGLGITKDNLTDNAYIYFGSGTDSTDQQQSAIASVGSNLVIKGGGNDAITIGNGGNTIINKALTLSGIGTTTVPGNLVIDINGTVSKSTTAPIWTEESGSATHDGGLNLSGGKFTIDTSGNTTIATNTQTTWSCSNDFIKLACGDASGARMLVQSNGIVNIEGALTVNGTPVSTTFYVQEQLAIKDKLINKLTERLDALEKRVK